MWSYLHVLVFASVAAVGAGLAVVIEAAAGPSELGPVGTAAAVAVPFAVYLMSLWGLYVRDDQPFRRFAVPVTAALVLLAPFTTAPVLLMGLAVALFVALQTVVRLRNQPV